MLTIVLIIAIVSVLGITPHLLFSSFSSIEYHPLKYRYTKKTGRKPNKYQLLLIYNIDTLYQKITGKDEITNKQCTFIRDLLKHFRLPISDVDHEDDIKNIRSRIRYLRKTGCSDNWVASAEDLKKMPLIFGGW